LGVFWLLCFIIVVYKGYLKAWMMVWLVYEKQPALCFFEGAGCFFVFQPRGNSAFLQKFH